MLKDDDAQIVGSWTIVKPSQKPLSSLGISVLDWLTERSKDYVILDE